MKDELYIPSVISKAITTNKARVKTFKTPDKWYGITYRDDLKDIKKEYSTLIEQYGAKSGVNEKGYLYFQSAKPNEETKVADEKIWLEINENNFCNLLNNQ